MRDKNTSNYDIICHIMQYCKNIEQLIERFGNDFNIFKNDFAFRDAVSMNILQIGELAGHLTDEYRNKTSSQIPWKAIKGMRNLFAHSYWQMDYKVIWSTAVESIPQLKIFCETQLGADFLVVNENIIDEDNLEI